MQYTINKHIYAVIQSNAQFPENTAIIFNFILKCISNANKGDYKFYTNISLSAFKRFYKTESINEYLTCLVSTDLININDNYKVGRYSRSYRLTAKSYSLLQQREVVKITLKLTNDKKIKKLYNAKIGSKPIDIYEKYYKKHLVLEKKWYEKSVDILGQNNTDFVDFVVFHSYDLENFNTQKSFNRNGTNFRLDTNITSINKELRCIFKFHGTNVGDLIKVDGKCFQPTLFYCILELILKTEYPDFKFKEWINAIEYTKLRNFIYTHLDELKELKKEYDNDIYLKVCPTDRKKGKLKFLKRFYENKVGIFTGVLGVFRDFIIKNVDFNVHTKKETLNAKFAVFLQRVESYLFITRFIDVAVTNNFLEFLTVHDCIMVKQENVKMVETVLYRIFSEVLGNDNILKLASEQQEIKLFI